MISTESILKKRLKTYKPEEILKLKLEVLGYNNEEIWENLMNDMYNSLKTSILVLKTSTLFLYYNQIFSETPYQVQMLKVLDKLEQSIELKLDKIDMIYKAGSSLIELLLREEDQLDEEKERGIKLK